MITYSQVSSVIGDSEGILDGSPDGYDDGLRVGSFVVGLTDGHVDGLKLGCFVGEIVVGDCEGEEVVGETEGS